jgi:hypothetical protein
MRGTMADQSVNELELLKLRLDYAWKWFDLHAKQRMTLFNYFLIIAGIFANAIIISVKDANNLINQPPVIASSAQKPAADTTMPSDIPPASMPVTQENAGVKSTTAAMVPPPAWQNLNALRRAIGVLGALASLAFIIFDVISRRLNSRAEAILEELEHAVLFPDAFRFTSDGSNRQLGLLRHENSQRIRDSGKFWARAMRMKLWIRGIEAMVGLFFLYSAFM